MKIKELQKLVTDFRDKRDRKQFHNPKDLVEAISIECWELMEHFLWKSQQESQKIAENNNDIAEEFADIMNYLLLFADICNIDIEESIIKKIKKNNLKYPVEKSKWKSDKYNKL